MPSELRERYGTELCDTFRLIGLTVLRPGESVLRVRDLLAWLTPGVES